MLLGKLIPLEWRRRGKFISFLSGENVLGSQFQELKDPRFWKNVPETWLIAVLFLGFPVIYKLFHNRIRSQVKLKQCWRCLIRVLTRCRLILSRMSWERMVASPPLWNICVRPAVSPDNRLRPLEKDTFAFLLCGNLVFRQQNFVGPDGEKVFTSEHHQPPSWGVNNVVGAEGPIQTWPVKMRKHGGSCCQSLGLILKS